MGGETSPQEGTNTSSFTPPVKLEVSAFLVIHNILFSSVTVEKRYEYTFYIEEIYIIRVPHVFSHEATSHLYVLF